jgi:hypothetical protein
MVEAKMKKSQSQEVLEILQAQIPRLLAQDPEDKEEFLTAYDAAIAVMRNLEAAGIIGDQTFMSMAREACDKRGKSRETALALLNAEYLMPLSFEERRAQAAKFREQAKTAKAQ